MHRARVHGFEMHCSWNPVMRAQDNLVAADRARLGVEALRLLLHVHACACYACACMRMHAHACMVGHVSVLRASCRTASSMVEARPMSRLYIWRRGEGEGEGRG